MPIPPPRFNDSILVSKYYKNSEKEREREGGYNVGIERSRQEHVFTIELVTLRVKRGIT